MGSVIMDIDRVINMGSDSHGSLLNRVYELQCMREKELETMDLTEQMSSLSFSVSVPPPNIPQIPQHNNVNNIASNQNDVMDEEMEDNVGDERYCQARARSDPVYLVQQQQLHQHQQQLHQQQQQLILQQLQQQQNNTTTTNSNFIVVDTHQYPSPV